MWECLVELDSYTNGKSFNFYGAALSKFFSSNIFHLNKEVVVRYDRLYYTPSAGFVDPNAALRYKHALISIYLDYLFNGYRNNDFKFAIPFFSDILVNWVASKQAYTKFFNTATSCYEPFENSLVYNKKALYYMSSQFINAFNIITDSNTMVALSEYNQENMVSANIKSVAANLFKNMDAMAEQPEFKKYFGGCEDVGEVIELIRGMAEIAYDFGSNMGSTFDTLQHQNGIQTRAQICELIKKLTIEKSSSGTIINIDAIVFNSQELAGLKIPKVGGGVSFGDLSDYVNNLDSKQYDFNKFGIKKS
jgi:hypothetical protein